MERNPQTRDYQSENQRRKQALEEEEEFLKKEVIGQGVESPDQMGAQNIQSNIERKIEKSEGSE